MMFTTSQERHVRLAKAAWCFFDSGSRIDYRRVHGVAWRAMVYNTGSAKRSRGVGDKRRVSFPILLVSATLLLSFGWLFLSFVGMITATWRVGVRYTKGFSSSHHSLIGT